MAFSLLVLFLLSCALVKSAESDSSFEECATRRNVLTRAFFKTGNNINELDKAFYPGGVQRPSRFIQVNYHFNNTGDGNCNVSYFWASGGFLLIQPPRIFLFNTLLFSYPANDLENVNLILPEECSELVNVTEDGCRCLEEGSALDRLTQQVRSVRNKAKV